MSLVRPVLGGRRGNASRGGFTLMELLVAVGLMVILITAVVIVFVKSTQVFRKAESLMEIFQNARAAIGTVGREVAGSFPIDSNNQEFIVHNPRNGSDAIEWEITDGAFPGVEWTRPLLVTITQTAWVDATVPAQPRVVGAAKVLYRLRHDPTGLYKLRNTTVTLERVLLKAERKFPAAVCTTKAQLDTINPRDTSQYIAARNPGGVPGGVLKIQEDLCKFVRYQPNSGNHASFHLEYFYVDPSGAANNRFFAEPGYTSAQRSNYPVSPGPNPTIIHFTPANATAAYQNLPIAIRIKMQVVDEQENEVRTVARVIWIPAARSD